MLFLRVCLCVWLAAGPILLCAAADQRHGFEASAYVGLSIDSFAAADLNRYLNPDVSSRLKERAVAGIDFAYRLAGDPARDGGSQLWLYGETVHGMRSADVDCAANPGVPVCRGALKSGLGGIGGGYLYMLRNATSLEAFSGLRWEFAALQTRSAHPARLYLKAQYGFISAAGSGQVVESSHQALGLITAGGRFLGSYFEAGHGHSNFFYDRPNHRLKADGYLTWNPGWQWMGAAGIRPFAQMTVDTGCGNHADSVQTYFGFTFDLDKLFGAGQ